MEFLCVYRESDVIFPARWLSVFAAAPQIGEAAMNSFRVAVRALDSRYQTSINRFNWGLRTLFPRSRCEIAQW